MRNFFFFPSLALQKHLKFHFTSFHERLKKVEGEKDGKRRRVGKEERKGSKGRRGRGAERAFKGIV
jgi:hypothetical protein